MRISFGKPWDDNADFELMMLGKLIQKMMQTLFENENFQVHLSWLNINIEPGKSSIT